MRQGGGANDGRAHGGEAEAELRATLEEQVLAELRASTGLRNQVQRELEESMREGVLAELRACPQLQRGVREEMRAAALAEGFLREPVRADEAQGVVAEEVAEDPINLEEGNNAQADMLEWGERFETTTQEQSYWKLVEMFEGRTGEQCAVRGC